MSDNDIPDLYAKNLLFAFTAPETEVRSAHIHIKQGRLALIEIHLTHAPDVILAPLGTVPRIRVARRSSPGWVEIALDGMDGWVVEHAWIEMGPFVRAIMVS
jgi:hypothetical protein